jgi:hypothetical protein
MNKSFLVYPFLNALCFFLILTQPPGSGTLWKIQNRLLRREQNQSYLPAGFHYAGDFTFKRQLSEADPAYPKIPHKSPRPSATMTPVMFTHREFRFFLRFFKKRLSGQKFSSNLKTLI